jgi:NADH:ubiquinone oxidoreductase subunit 3 (subunit A)
MTVSETVQVSMTVSGRRAISLGSIKDDTAEFRTQHPYLLALCFMLLGGAIAYLAGLALHFGSLADFFFFCLFLFLSLSLSYPSMWLSGSLAFSRSCSAGFAVSLGN